MKKILYIFSIILLLLSCMSYLYADNVSISADVNNNVISVDDNVVLTVTVSGDAKNLPEPELPQLNGFTAYSSGRSQNISIINGRVSSSLVYNYVLSPRTAGTYKIGSVVLKYKGNEYKTDSIIITVNPASPAPQTQIGTTAQPSQVKRAQQKSAKNIFITTHIDKKTAYVNEPITLTFRFYSRVNILSRPAYSPPVTTGFWAEDLPPQKDYVGTYNGVNYKIIEIKTALFPTAPGAYTISPAQLQCNVEDFSSDIDDFFASFFSRGKTVTLESKPINVKIKPLPNQNKPDSFSGSVGAYNMSVEHDRDIVQAGEAINLIVKVKGTGNIKSIGEPVLKNTSNYKQYDTITSHNISKQGFKVSGSKTFKIVIVPKVSGNIELPDVVFSYFDIKSKKYKTITSIQKKITVAPGQIQQSDKTGLAQTALTRDVKVIASDIRYIKKAGKLKSSKLFIYKNLWFILILLFFPALYFAVIGAVFYNEHIRRHGELYRRKKALKNSLNKIELAVKKLKKGDKNVQQVLFHALSGYLGHKFNLSPSGLTLKTVIEILEDIGTEQIVLGQIKEIWEELDFMRFAPSQITEQKVKELTQKLKKNITQWEKKIKI
ncbi:BatD family protein [bacterium]